ncbi:hypothetical protein CH289_07830 [Rhodococcus sp. RS1C4]|nr:hypothetical protein [Rhodococcus sp. RS1C4]OZC55091.1 hypothetical protein CH289_07830 [Rhodococcus sp. RS1C4]
MSLAELVAGQSTKAAPTSTTQWLNTLNTEDRDTFWSLIDRNYPTSHLWQACRALGLPASETTFRRHLKELEHP